MSDKHFKIIEQIQKLFRLSKSPNIHEAALALEKARLLMQKYSISEEEASDSKSASVDDIIEIDFLVAHSAENYTIKLSYWLAEAFFCKVMMVKRNVGEDKIKFESSIRFIGKKSDVAISTFVYAYTCSILETKSSEYVKEHKGKRIKHDFSLGYVEAVCDKLRVLKSENDAKMTTQETEQVNALVVIKNALINRYMDEKYGQDRFEGGGQKVEFNPSAYQDGHTEGSKQGIFRGVEQKETKIKNIK